MSPENNKNKTIRNLISAARDELNKSGAGEGNIAAISAAMYLDAKKREKK